MSDVWQGPGWWLASDGKWYPADAEPGSVYEGDLPNTETQPDEVAADSAVDPVAEVAAEAQETDVAPVVDVAPDVTHGLPGSPEPAEVAAVVEKELAAASEVPEESPALGANPFAQMPAPIVEAHPLPEAEAPRLGGWQAIAPEDDASASTASTIPATGGRVESTADEGPPTEDGWTSAYEERQDTGVVLDEESSGTQSTPGPVEPPSPSPLIQEADAPLVDIDTPAVETPTFEAPAVEEPMIEAPTFDAPAVEEPPLEAPAVEEPMIEAPTLGAPIPGVVPSPIPDVAPPPATVIDAPTAPRDPGPAIERNDAWRKPLAPDTSAVRPDAPMPTGAPDVVDLAIPDEPRVFEDGPESRNWGLIGGIAIGIIAIAGLAWLIASLFTGGDDPVETNDTSSSSVSEPATGDTADTSAPVTEPDNSDVSVFALRAGDCIVGDIGAGQVTKVTKVDCELEHQFEVYREALIDSSITAFDEEAISAYAEEVCRTSLEAYVPADDERGLKFKFLQPTEDSWNQTEDPDRVITCLLFDDDAPLVGRAG